MSEKHRHSLPFDAEDFEFSKFEAFVTSLLETSEVLPIEDSSVLIRSPKTVHRYGKRGDNQRGIDILAEIDGGQRVAIQCKYHDPSTKTGRVTLSEAKKAVRKAEEKYPADHYILVTNIEHNQPDAIEFIAKKKNWTLWGKHQLHAITRNLPLAKAWHLIVDHFGESVAWEFFPLGPALFLTPKEYRKLGSGSLSHQYSCVGRDAEIRKISNALVSKKPQAVLTSGDGGVGKSRLFLEALTQIELRHPDFKVLVAEPDTRGKWEQLNLAGDQPLIIGLEDCHMPSRLDRKFLIHARLRPNTRLFLMSRPGGLDDIRVDLRETGWEKSFVEPLGKDNISVLKLSAMTQLAKEIIGHDHEDIPKIVRLSNGNALFTVVACEKVRDKKWRINQMLTAEEFQQEVFVTLRDQMTSGLAQKKIAILTATCLALLSPFQIKDYPRIAQLLQIRDFELEEEVIRLQNLGLLRLGGDTGRIVPDLFSDYLIQNAFPSGQGDPLLNRLYQSDLFYHQNTSIFRNLALAQWHQQLEIKNAPSLVEPLWKKFQSQFEIENDSKREVMLKTWKRFGLYLPDESLTLCRKAIELKPNPPENPYWDAEKNRSFYKNQLENQAVDILQNLARYHVSNQAEALDSLWTLALGRDESLKHGGKEVFSQIFSYEKPNTIKMIESALGWLEDKIDEPDAWKALTERPTPFVQILLENLFSHSIERSLWEGNTVRMWSVPILIDNTAPLRQRAFKLIEKIAFASPFGAKNCLNLLSKIAAAPSGTIGGSPFSEAFLQQWMSVRLQALDILKSIAAVACDPIILHQVRSVAKQLLEFNEEQAIEAAASEIIENIEASKQFPDVERLVILLSASHEEFSNGDENLDYREQRKEADRQWNQLASRVANEIIKDMSRSEEIASWCTSVYSDLKKLHLGPSFHTLFNAIHQVDPALTEGLRNRILSDEHCVFEGNYAQLAFWLQTDLDLQDEHLSQAVRMDRPRAFTSLLNVLQYNLTENPLQETKLAVIKLFSQLASEEISSALDILNFVRGNDLVSLIYTNLPWNRFEKKHFAWLGSQFRNHGNALLLTQFPHQAFLPIFTRLNELPADTIQDVSDLIIHACHVVPEEAFEFFHRRVQQAAETNEYVQVFPSNLDEISFGDLSKVPQLEQKIDFVFRKAKEDSDSSELWNEWLTIILSKQGKLEERLLLRRISEYTSAADILNFISKHLKLFQVYNYPKVIGTLLTKTEALPRKSRDEIFDAIFRRAISHGNSYTNGERDDSWHLDTARSLSETYRDNPSLHSLYDRIVKFEQADAEKHRRNHIQETKDHDTFD